MIKSIIKVLIAVAIANTLWHVASAYLSYYRFEDSVHELALHSADRTESQVKDKVAELAAMYDEPLEADAIEVKKEELHTYVNGSYIKSVNLFPGYDYQLPFVLKVEAFVIEPPKLH